MNGITPLTIPVNHLTNLGPERAVEFFRRLLWAETARVGLARHLIDVPDCINVGDGGIDAFIKDAGPSIDAVIPSGTSGFQIKSSDLFPSDCRKELHQKGDLNEPLKPEIKRILDEDGTYILVLFADIPSPKETTKREDALRNELVSLAYKKPKFRLYTANQLAAFAERFPGLVAWFKNERSQCLPYPSWAQNRDIITPKEFVYDDERKGWIEEIRKTLRNPNNQCPVFRVTGLSGIGKTRLVFEALSPDDLKHRVVYVRADSFRLSSLHNTLQNDENLSAIIVIDECDLQQHDEMVRSFSGRGTRLAVLTISHDIGKVSPPSTLYELKPLGNKEIEEILKAEAPQLPNDVVHRLSQFADGYPRIAILLAESYLMGSSSSDEFITISDDALINRLISGRIDVNSEHFRRTKKVLTGLSLFHKVGYEGRLSKESEWVADLMGVNWDEFREVVVEQKRRGIIQGQNYLYVTPFMLRVHLLKDWWETHGLTKDSFNEFIEKIPKEFRADLLQRFFDNIPYITTTERGREFAEAILGEEGVFADGSLLRTKLGADFFLKLTEADAESALNCLKRTVGAWSRDELLQFTTGRREVVWALEKIAMWRNLFSDAARLLLALGRAENETYSNNASGIFAQLFSPGRGPVAPTEASPQERFPILLKALESNSKERRMLALQACDQALESYHFSRMVGAEYQGLRKEPKLWIPKTWGEIYDAYRQVWQLLREQLDSLVEDEREQAVDILLQRARDLGRFPDLADMVIDTLTELGQKPYANTKKVLEQVVQILHYEGKNLPEETRQRWEQLKNELTGNDFSSLLKRYAGMNLLEDKFDEQGNRIDLVKQKVKELAKQAIKNNNILRPELNWLMTTEAQNGYRFGYELGNRDKDFSLLPTLLKAQRNVGENASAFFLGGYFRALFEKNQLKWEEQLDTITDDKKLNLIVPELTWRSGMSDRAALRILSIAQKGIITINHFRIFALGSVIRDLSEDVFKKWIKFLVNSFKVEAIRIALDLYHFYYLGKESRRTLPKELTLQLLIHPLLFQKSEENRHDVMTHFHWKEIGKAFVKLYPDESLEIAEKMLEHFGEDGTIVESHHSESLIVLNEITQRYPKEIWQQVAKYLGPPIDSRSFHLKDWLRGSGFFDEKDFDKKRLGMLPMFPLEQIWKWVDEDVEKRAWYIASFVPKTLFREEGKTCLAREVLVRYGTREDVRSNLMANFSSEGWSGPASLHYQHKKQRLLDFKKEEDNENVKQWIDEYISSLEQQIEWARIKEERRGF